MNDAKSGAIVAEGSLSQLLKREISFRLILMYDVYISPSRKETLQKHLSHSTFSMLFSAINIEYDCKDTC